MATKKRSEQIKKIEDKRKRRKLIKEEIFSGLGKQTSFKLENLIMANIHKLKEDENIELSVCIPLFRAKYCAWLALEGLCRQRNIDFHWELVLAEETKDEAFTEQEILKYKDRLKQAGCVRIIYIPLDYWIPLARKYNLLAHNCFKGSKIYCSCAADLYPPPKRLKTQYDFFNTDPNLDWCANAKTISYDIETERYYLFDLTMKSAKRKNDGSNKAFRMEIMRNLPKGKRERNVDGWIWHSANSYVRSKKKDFKFHLDTSDNWKYGLSVNGLNNISLNRSKRFKSKIIKRDPRLRECPIDINNTIPKDIMDRLRNCKQYIKLHKIGLPRRKK